jgi:hypothetical protein
LREENCKLKSASMISKISIQCALVLALFFYSPVSLAAPKAKNRIGLGIESSAFLTTGLPIQGLGLYTVSFFGLYIGGFFTATSEIAYGRLISAATIVTGFRFTFLPILIDVSVGNFRLLTQSAYTGAHVRFGNYWVTDSKNVFTLYYPDWKEMDKHKHDSKNSQLLYNALASVRVGVVNCVKKTVD